MGMDDMEKLLSTLQENVRMDALYGIKRCDNCHKAADHLITYQWYAAKKGRTNQYTSERKLTGSGYSTTTVTQTSYGNIVPILTGLCPQCFRKALNTRRIIAAILILVLVGVLISAKVSQGTNTVQILSLLILIPVSISQLKHFKKGESKFHKDLFEFHARMKMGIQQDTLWTPDEYSRLR